MVKHLAIARPLLGCALWSLTLLAAAQTEQPQGQLAPPQNRLILMDRVRNPSDQPTPSDTAEKSGKQAIGSFISSGSVRWADNDQIRQQFEERQAKLRAQLADPKQRAQLMTERIQQQRSVHPDLAAVVQLDARTEEKLLALLVDQRLSQELGAQPAFGRFTSHDMAAPGKPYDPMRDEAERYTQNMAELGKLIGATRLEDYINYQRTVGERMVVGQFDRLLPAQSKLTLEQRNALVELLHQQSQNNATRSAFIGRSFFRFNASANPAIPSQEDLSRRMQIGSLVMSERALAIQEAANRDAVEAAASILTPEQLKVLADSKQQQLEQQRSWAQSRRAELRITPEEEVELSDRDTASPPISKNLKLAISISVNDTQMTKELLSVRGGSVSMQGPEGLQLEVRPYMDQDQLMAELKVYEKARGGRQLLSRLSGSATLTTPDKLLQFNGNGATMLRGRKGYSMVWSVSGAYQ